MPPLYVKSSLVKCAVVKSWSGFYGWGEVGWVPQGAGGQEQEASVHANQESEFKDQLMLEESS